MPILQEVGLGGVGARGLYEQVQEISPPHRLELRSFQCVGSRYTDYAIPATNVVNSFTNKQMSSGKSFRMVDLTAHRFLFMTLPNLLTYSMVQSPS